MTTDRARPAGPRDPLDAAATMPPTRTRDGERLPPGPTTGDGAHADPLLRSEPGPGPAGPGPAGPDPAGPDPARADPARTDSARPDAGPVGVTGGTGDVSGGAADSLIPHELGEGYRTRWAAVQGDFIDAPRSAVTDADALVGDVLDQLAATFRTQRDALEQQWADNHSSTEDLRIALRRYRTFFDRLLSL